MNVNELEKLAIWYIAHFKRVNQLYQGLISPVQHNATQQSKQPLENELNALVDYLSDMDFEELSLQQIDLLEELGVAQYIGVAGAKFVEQTVKTSDYDPSTAQQRLTEASGALGEVNGHFKTYIQVIASLKLDHTRDTEPEDFITIRVGFQNDASIDNMTDWKDSAKDWYDIIRGLAMASDEAPEDTKIVGASTGSIILILAGTLSVTTLLALISGRITAVAKHVIGISNEIEDLRHKKFLNQVIEKELKGQQETAKKEALDEIIALIAAKLPDLDGEKKTALTGSVKKLLAFNEKGGHVDFVAPDNDGDGGEAEDGAGQPQDQAQIAMAAARQAIHEYQEIREQLKLISDHSSADDELST